MALSRSRIAWTVLSCALRPRDLEVVIGDLEEEYAWRSRSTPGALPWYWGQVVRSIPVFLWIPVRRGGWLSTVGVAFAACGMQAIIELTLKAASASLLPSEARWPVGLTLVVTLSSLAFVSYLASRIRPGAATMLTAIVLCAVLLQIVVKSGHGLSFGAQLFTLVAGPAMAFVGGVLFLKTSAGPRAFV